jgi:hypothetical protein
VNRENCSARLNSALVISGISRRLGKRNNA